MLNLDSRQSKIFLILISVIVLLVGFNIYRESGFNQPVVQLKNDMQTQFPANRGSNEEVQDDGVKMDEVETSGEELYIKVYIAGQVKYPGVIELSEGSRLSEAVELAGGLLEDADLLRINLALRVKDEGMYIIPKIGEDIPAPVGVEHVDAQAQGEEGKININSADKALLETLPGIGPSRAQGIIEHRERHGHFETIDELKDVTGIGDKIFEGLRDFITVN
jgi:competence protein ComEA